MFYISLFRPTPALALLASPAANAKKTLTNVQTIPAMEAFAPIYSTTTNATAKTRVLLVTFVEMTLTNVSKTSLANKALVKT